MIIFSDIDGTLLDDSGEVSPGNLSLLKKDSNNRYVLASGRNCTQILDFIEENKIHCDIIGGNGAFIKKWDDDIKVNHYIDTKIVSYIVRKLLEIKIPFIVNTATYNIIDSSINIDKVSKELANAHVTEYDSEYIFWTREYEKIFIEHSNIVEDIEYFIKTIEPKVTKIEILSSNYYKLENVKMLFKNLHGIRIEKSYLTNIEIVDKNTSKGNAILDYLKRYKVNDVEETISVGDNYNDQSMFYVTDYSYAVANAVQDLKNVKYLKSSSSEDFLIEILKEVGKYEENNISITKM